MKTNFIQLLFSIILFVSCNNTGRNDRKIKTFNYENTKGHNRECLKPNIICLKSRENDILSYNEFRVFFSFSTSKINLSQYTYKLGYITEIGKYYQITIGIRNSNNKIIYISLINFDQDFNIVSYSIYKDGVLIDSNIKNLKAYNYIQKNDGVMPIPSN